MKKSDLRQLIREEISKVMDEASNLKFKDLQIGQKFLRFGENGQMWEKVNNKQAKFIKNVGKKTAPYSKKYGVLDVFPPTMDVTIAITPNN